MGMKNKLGALMATAAALSAGNEPYGLGGMEYDRKETPEEKRIRLKKQEASINMSNGLSKFYYGDNYVWALNQKTADKKAKAKGYI